MCTLVCKRVHVCIKSLFQEEKLQLSHVHEGCVSVFVEAKKRSPFFCQNDFAYENPSNTLCTFANLVVYMMSNDHVWVHSPK